MLKKISVFLVIALFSGVSTAQESALEDSKFFQWAELVTAIKTEDWGVANKLIIAGADVDQKGPGKLVQYRKDGVIEAGVINDTMIEILEYDQDLYVKHEPRSRFFDGDVSFSRAYNDSPLMYLARSWKAPRNVIAEAVKRSKNVNAKDINELSILANAAKVNNHFMVDELIKQWGGDKKILDVNATGYAKSALFEAYRNLNFESAKRLHDANANIYISTDDETESFKLVESIGSDVKFDWKNNSRDYNLEQHLNVGYEENLARFAELVKAHEDKSKYRWKIIVKTKIREERTIDPQRFLGTLFLSSTYDDSELRKSIERSRNYVEDSYHFVKADYLGKFKRTFNENALNQDTKYTEYYQSWDVIYEFAKEGIATGQQVKEIKARLKQNTDPNHLTRIEVEQL